MKKFEKIKSAMKGYSFDPSFNAAYWISANSDLSKALNNGYKPKDAHNIDPSCLESFLIDLASR